MRWNLRKVHVPNILPSLLASILMSVAGNSKISLTNFDLRHLKRHLYVASQVTDSEGSGLVGYRCPLLLR